MRSVRVMVVDDEALARQIAVEYLGACEGVEVVAECGNGYEAVKAVSEAVPDVLLLDVQMPKLSGFDVLELSGPGPAEIFATAHDDYALKAFEVHAVDYLLKPFSQARLAEAIDRARARLAANAAAPSDEVVGEREALSQAHRVQRGESSIERGLERAIERFRFALERGNEEVGHGAEERERDLRFR